MFITGNPFFISKAVSDLLGLAVPTPAVQRAQGDSQLPGRFATGREGQEDRAKGARLTPRRVEVDGSRIAPMVSGRARGQRVRCDVVPSKCSQQIGQGRHRRQRGEGDGSSHGGRVAHDDTLGQGST
jgi:hypothetical protein